MSTNAKKKHPPKPGNVDGRSAYAKRRKKIRSAIISALGHQPSVIEDAIVESAVGMIIQTEEINRKVFSGSRKAGDLATRNFRALSSAFQQLGISVAGVNSALEDGRRESRQATRTRRQQDQLSMPALAATASELIDDPDELHEIFGPIAEAMDGLPAVGDVVELSDGTKAQVLSGHRLRRIGTQPRVRKRRKRAIRQ